MKTLAHIQACEQNAFAALGTYAGRPLALGEECDEHIANLLTGLLHLVGSDRLAEAMKSAEHHARCDYVLVYTEATGDGLEDVRNMALAAEEARVN